MDTVFLTVKDTFVFEAYGFSTVYLSLSVGVEQPEADHLMILIYYFVGNVSNYGDNSGRNSAFDDRYL